MFAVEVEAGRSKPLPWYWAYFAAGDECGVPPWELIDEPTPRQFWMEAALIIREARGRKQRDDASKQALRK